jgi:hypothetical protein
MSPSSRPGLGIRTAACLAWLSLALVLPLSATALETAAELQAEIARQQELLDELQREPTEDELAQESDIASRGGRLDPRTAPTAPELRELPVAIFDETKVTIPAGDWGNAEPLRVLQRFLDADGDGKPELLRFISRDSEFILHQEEDRNYDGRLDAISSFEWGELKRRRVDDDGDGVSDGWEEYDRGRMTRREVDRDRDGTRDVFYEYDGDELVTERHDANNDGKIDREVLYKDRVRLSATDDTNYDGQVDTWYTYALRDGREIITRIERDKQGRGKPDVFEIFVAHDGKAVLTRREEDHDGDGTADLVSVFRDGRLVRRELSKPDLRPL